MSRGPLLATLLLRLRAGQARREEILADLDELFERRSAAHGVPYARRRYWADVLSFFLPAAAGAGTRIVQSTPRPRGVPMSAFAFDLRQAARSVTRQPAFFAVASLTLGVGFAAHLAAFGVVDRMLLAGPPHVQDADRIVRLHIDRADPNTGGRFLWFQTPYRSFEDLRRAGGPFEKISGYRETTASVGSGADARQVSVILADHDYFPLLGVAAQRGRVFGAEENRRPSATPVAVLSDAYWRAAHGSDDAVLGQTIRVGAIACTVIGIMPPGFTGDGPRPVDLWIPFHVGSYELPAGWDSSYLFRSVTVLAKLAPGMPRSAAAGQATDAYRRVADKTPAADPTAFAVLASLLPGRAQRGELNPEGRIALWIEGVALLVLLVALANVVNLQMSRAAQQKRDLAVRVALGATRIRLLSRLALEMLFISCAAAGIGVVLTYWTATTLQQILLPGSAVIVPARFAAMVLGTALLAAALCTALSAFQVRLTGAGERLKTGRGGDGFSRERLRQGLLVGQMVVSSLLLVGAGLFLRSIDRLGRLDFGHDQERVLVVTMPLRGAGYAPAAIEAIYDRALVTLAAVPGVERVAAAQTTPFAPSQSAPLSIPGRERLPMVGNGFPTFYTVTPAFFDTMGMRVLRGRGFTGNDIAGAPPVMVLEDALARAMWPGEDALGKCMVVGAGTTPCREVVGIVSNTRRFVRTSEGALRFYLPMAQRFVPATPQALFVRTSGDPARATDLVRSALLGIDGRLPHIRMRTLAEMAEPEKRPWRMGSTLFVVFGFAALLVATAGVYALLSFLVAQRSREIGVRLALGAGRARTVNLVVRQSLAWVAGGLAGGLAAALVAARFVRPMLFETSPYDPAVFAGAAGLLALVSIVASMVPAWRASRVDPNIALRAE